MKENTEMHIEFLDQLNVVIKKSLFWDGLRPQKKIIIKKHIIVKEFEKKYKDFKVEAVSGPDSVSNFRKAEDAEATWYLKVKKTKPLTKSKAPTKKAAPKSRTPREATAPGNSKSQSSKTTTRTTKEV